MVVSSPPQVDVHARAQKTFVSLEFHETDVREALRRLGRQYLFGISVAPNVHGTVNIDLRGVTFEVAIANIVRQVDASFRIDHGFYTVVLGREPPIVEPAWIFGSDPEPTKREMDWWVERTSNAALYESFVPFIEFEKTDVRVALSWLFQKFRVPYRFDPKVRGLVTVSLRDATFEKVIQAMAWQAKATYWRENGVFEIRPM